MSRRRIAAFVALALVAIPGTALAGAAMSGGVYIAQWPNTRYAGGSVHDVRHTPDAVSNIYCYDRAISPTSSQGVCYATSATGEFLMCTTSDPNVRSIIRSINESSYIEFQVPNGGYDCSSLTVYNGSWFVD
jgi:hypothetical protein